MRGFFFLVALTVFLVRSAFALNVPSNGTDGALDVPAGSGNYTIDLSQAATGDWQATNGAGKGVYDPAVWAVVFKYTTVNIPANRTVVFTNHSSRAPVIWLVSGNVTIGGAVQLTGGSAVLGGSYTEPGPGGFRGGRSYVNTSILGSAGFGPGGGGYSPGNSGLGGGYGSTGGGTGGGVVYGNPRVLPLIGGSGGGGSASSDTRTWYSGGAGGGAILIACAGNFSLTGQITSVGGGGLGYYQTGSGGGSGGAIRIITNAFVAGSTATGLTAIGGIAPQNGGGFGRIRIEANSFAGFSGSSSPDYSRLEGLGTDAVIFPAADAPAVRVVSVGGVAAPADPRASLAAPGDVWLTDGNSQEVVLETTNVPTDGTWSVVLRLAPSEGTVLTPNAVTLLTPGPPARWHAILPNLPVIKVTDLQARVAKTGS